MWAIYSDCLQSSFVSVSLLDFPSELNPISVKYLVIICALDVSHDVKHRTNKNQIRKEILRGQMAYYFDWL